MPLEVFPQVSIHLMLLLIQSPYHKSSTTFRFNTSHVTINQTHQTEWKNKLQVSIHLMLLLIETKDLVTRL